MSNCLLRKSWPLGFIPSDDNINGRRDGLLRMKNLTLDENGQVKLVKGFGKLNETEFASWVHTCYSRFLDLNKYRWVALADGTVHRAGPDNNFTEIISGGAQTRAGFTSFLGHILIASGRVFKKDTGTDVWDLGVGAPGGPPTVVGNSQPALQVVTTVDDWTSVDGVFAKEQDYIYVTTDGNGMGVGYREITNGIDTMSIGGGKGTPEDLLSWSVSFSSPLDIDYVRLDFILDDLDSQGSLKDVANYYHYTWSTDEYSGMIPGTDTWSKLSAKRKDFTREGASNQYDWGNVRSVRVTAKTKSGGVVVRFKAIQFSGGTLGPLNGSYEYMQVNVRNTGTYYARSTKSAAANAIRVVNGSATITPVIPSDPQVNELWIYRRSFIRTDYTEIDNNAALDKWYRVGVAIQNLDEFGNATYNDVTDVTSDDDALTLNLYYNENDISVQSIPDPVYCIVPHNDRVLYMTFKEIYISEPLCPDLVDSSITLKIAGSVFEKNLWLVKVGDGPIYAATTNDIYEITGTFARFPDGTLDLRIRGLGIPAPLSNDYAVDTNTIAYVARDGIRILSGGSSRGISDQFDLLFRGEDRYGILSFLITPNEGARYPLVIANGKLYVSMPMRDSSYRCFVYDFMNDAAGRPTYWYEYYTDPTCFFYEEDGILTAGYGGGSGNYLRQLEVGDDMDGTTGMDLELLTVYDDDNLPRNRKDSFTFKMLADTGNVAVSVYIAKGGSDNYIKVGDIAFNGLEEHLITIAENIGLGKNFQVRILGTGLNTFELKHFGIEYDPRPEQLTYLRIPYNNMGTQSRKRFINYAFVIDTLGVQCEFFPLIDGAIAGPSSIFSMDRKGTNIHFFDSEQAGIDIGGIICGFFEFYNINIEETITEKMPQPATYWLIPQDDYGVPARKRHSSYKFLINTRGGSCQFRPRIDGVWKDPLIFTTDEKQIVEYFFTTDTIGINIGGELKSLESPTQPFEFYGVIKPEKVEVLPPRLKEFRIPENNYGHAAKKRIRTMPMEINTYGYNVTFTPIVDHVRLASSTLNTPARQTTFHYFDTDIFGIDYSGELVGLDYPFEFYGLLNPETVEIIPVGKKFDQVGPIHINRIGKIIGFRLRCIATGSSIPYTMYAEDTVIHTGTILTTPNIDNVYEVEYVPKSKQATIFRLELGGTGTAVFHRYYVEFKINFGGMQGDSRIKWIKVQDWTVRT